MTTFELECTVLDTLYGAITTGLITPEDAGWLPERLGCLALNLFDAYQKTIDDLPLAVSWLLYRRRDAPPGFRYNQAEAFTTDLPPVQITLEEQTLGERWLAVAVELGFLVKEKEVLSFPDNNLQDYFCAVYCMKQPVDNDMLNRTFPHTWYVWSDLDIFLPDKVWQFIKDQKEDEEYMASSLLGTIGEFSLRKNKSVWSKITEEHIVTLLIEGLKNDDCDVRERAASILSGMLNPRIIEPFLVALHDTNPSVRAGAAIGLGTLKENRAIPELIHLLDDEDEYVRQQVIYGLSYLGDPAAVEPLINTLKYDEDAAHFAASVLGSFQDSRAVEPLIEALSEDWEQLRANAAESLGNLGDKRALEPLALALNDAEEKVRSMAAYGLGMLGDRRGYAILIENLQIDPEKPGLARSKAWRAARALGNIGDKKAVSHLLAALDNNYSNLRKYIAEALGKLKDPIAKESLIQLLQDKDTDIRAVAAAALGQLGDQSVIALLKVLAENDASCTSEGVKIKHVATSAITQILLVNTSDKSFVLSQFETN